jgi:hypothetical protein
MSVMNARGHNLANILALGTVATVLLCTGLFWARSLCGLQRYDRLRRAAPEVRATLDLSRLRPDGRQSDPNLVRPYRVTARLQPATPLLTGLGAVQYLLSRMPTGPESNVYRWSSDPDAERLYFDTTLGQMVYEGTHKVTQPDGRVTRSPFGYCAGPEGVAPAPDEKLGRFVDPIVDRHRMRPWIVYDRAAGRFFAVDWSGRTVKKGPELALDDAQRPVQIGTLEKNPWALYTMGMTGAPGRNLGDAAGDAGPNVIMGLMSMTDYTPVLDTSGRIRFLDVDTLELGISRMRLPAPGGLYAERRPAAPRDVAAYCVQPLSIFSAGDDRKWSSLGCVVATLSGDATLVQLEVFDPNGGLVASDETSIPQYAETGRGEITRRASMSSTQAAYFRLPGAYGLTLAKLALESLHPPVLLLLSYFPASVFEATAGYRSLLLLPDSFLAMKARDKQGRPVEEFFASMAFAVPALILALLLAWRVDRDGGRLGLSKNVRTAWLVGTVLFGLPAYITYRLTRPKPTLVTCANCGLGRRPDLEKCHHCGSPWIVPELTPPAWRVRGEQEYADAGAPAQGSAANSPAE